MAKITYGLNPTNVKLRVKLLDSSKPDGSGLTGLTNTSTGLVISTLQNVIGANGESSAVIYRSSNSTIDSITTLGTYAVPTTNHCRFREVNSASLPGIYEIQLADSRFSATGDTTKNMTLLVSVFGAANLAQSDFEIECMNRDANIVQWKSTNVAEPTTAGIPDINVKNINNIATTSVTTINANQGTIEPVNFTNTGSSAIIKSDMIDVAGSAVSTSTAQIGVNVVSQNDIDFGTLQKASLNAATPASIIGSVGSVTGDIGGNVIGSIGSISSNGITDDSFAETVTVKAIRTAVTQSSSSGSITLDALASSVNKFYNDTIIMITAGTGVGQSRLIIDYDGSTKIASITPEWEINPDNSSVFVIKSQSMVNVAAISGIIQTPHDIGAGVLLTSGVGAGQIDLSSGQVKVQQGTLVGQLDVTSGVIKSNQVQVDGTVNVSHAAGMNPCDVNSWKGNTPNDIKSGRIDSYIGELANDVITASSINTNAITSDAIAANAIGNSQIADATISSSKFTTDAIDSDILAKSAVDEIASAILVTPSNKLATDTVGRVSNYPSETMILTSGQAQTGGTNTLRLAVGFLTNDDIYKGAVLKLYSGTGTGQVRSIISYNGTTGDVTVDRNWIINPDNTTFYSIIAVDAQISSGDFTIGAIDSNVIAANAISNTQIANAAISNDKFATDAIDSNVIASSGVTEIASGILQNTSNKITTDSSGFVTLSDSSITSTKFATGAITSTVIAANTIGNSQIADAAISVSKFANNAIDSNILATSAVNEIASAILLTPTNKIGADSSGRVSNIPAETLILATGQAQNGGHNTLQLAVGYSDQNDFYKGAVIKLYSGTGSGQVRSIIAYDGSTGNITVNRDWVINPDATTFYSIIAIDRQITSNDFDSNAITSDVLASSSINEIVSAILVTPANKLATDISGYVTLVDNSLTNAKIADDAISSSKFAIDAIDSDILAKSAVDEIVSAILVTPTNKLSTDTSGYVTLVDSSLTSSKFATDAINSSVLATSAINEIASAILLTPANKLSTDTFGYVTLVDNSLTASKFAADAINSDVFATSTIDEIASAILLTPTNKLSTDINGYVTLVDDSLTNAKIADGTISASKFATDAVNSNVLAASAVNEIATAILLTPTNKLATDISGNVTLVDGSLTNTKFATDAIDSDVLATSAVNEIASVILVNPVNKLSTDVDGNVTLVDNSLTNAKIADGAISASKFTTNAIDSDVLATSAVNEIVSAILVTPTNKLATDISGNVTLVDGSLTASKIATDAITSDALATSAINEIAEAILLTPANKLSTDISGNVTLVDNSLTNAKIADSAISASKFAIDAINSNVLATSAVNEITSAILLTPTNKLSTDVNGYVTLVDDSLTNAKIADDAITASKFATDAIDSDILAKSAIDEIVSSILVTPANKLSTNVSGQVTLVDGSLTNSKIADAAISASKFATDAIDSNVLAASAVNEIAVTTTDQVWDELRASHTVIGSFGNGVNIESLNSNAKSQVNIEVDQALVDYDGSTKTDLDTAKTIITDNITAVSNKIGSPISLSGGTATISGMLTNMADDNGGASFSSTYNSLAKLVTEGVNVQNIADTVWNTTLADHNIVGSFGSGINEIKTDIGNPISLDGGTASLSGMLTKMADDNNGADFDAAVDSQHTISLQNQSIIAKPQVATNGIVNTGNVITGTYATTNSDDGTYFRITPTGSAPINLDLFFTIPSDSTAVRLLIKGYYSAPTPIEGKWVDVYIKNQETGNYDKLSGSVSRMNPLLNEIDYSYYLLNEHLLQGNDINIKFISNDTNIASNLYLDYVTVDTVGRTVAYNIPGEIAQAVWQTQFAAVDQFSAAGFLKNTSRIAYTEITSVTSNTSFKVKDAPPENTTWIDHTLIYRNVAANTAECVPIQSADTNGNVVLYRALSVVPKVGDAILIGDEIWIKGINTSSIQNITNSVWDELRLAHVTAGSFGQGVASVQGNITGNLQGNVAGSINSLASQAKADVLAQSTAAITNYDVPNRTNLASVESNIRGADNDTLKTLSDQLDGVQTTVNGISNVTRLTVSLPEYMTRPATGSKALKIEVALKDDNGMMEDPDNNQLTLQVYDSTGNDFNINLYKDKDFSEATDLGTAPFTQFRKLVRSTIGIYYVYFRLDSTTTETELVFKFGWQENSIALYEYRGSQISDATNDISAIMSTVSNIKTKTDKMRFDAANRIESDAEAISASTTAADTIEANISNLNASISSRSTLNSTDIETATANAILQTPANKLKTDVSGRIEVSGTKNKIDSLNDISISDILNGVVDTKTIKQTLEVLLAYAQGKIVKTGSSYTYYKQDNSTSLFTLTATPSDRARS